MREDLPPLTATQSAEDPLGGTYEASSSAAFSSTRSCAPAETRARPRGCWPSAHEFLDKLRRYKLDDGSRDSERPVSIGDAGE